MVLISRTILQVCIIVLFAFCVSCATAISSSNGQSDSNQSEGADRLIKYVELRSELAKLEEAKREELAGFGKKNKLAKQMVEGFITGLHKSPYHGFSVEFAEHRLYNAGESTRDIDWKVYARTDKLFTKRYEEETNLRCQLVIDNSSSMYYPKNNYG